MTAERWSRPLGTLFGAVHGAACVLRAGGGAGAAVLAGAAGAGAGWWLARPPHGWAATLSLALLLPYALPVGPYPRNRAAEAAAGLLPLALAAGARGLASVRGLGVRLRALDRHAPAVAAALVVGALVVGAGCSWLQLRHFGDRAGAMDTAYYTQVLWSARHGGAFTGSLFEEVFYDPPLRSHFGMHNSPVLFLLQLLFLLWPGPAVLLLVRDLAVVAGAALVYPLARLALRPWAACVSVLLFLALPTIGYQFLHSFHPYTLGLPLVLLALLGVRAERRALLAAGALGLLLIREDLAIPAAALCALAAFRPRLRRTALALAAASAAWWLVSVTRVLPHFGPSAGAVVRQAFQPLGDTEVEMVRRTLSRPWLLLQAACSVGMVPYLVRLLLPCGWLGLPTIAGLAALPTMLLNLVAGRDVGFVLDVQLHYSIVPAALLFGGFVETLGSASRAAPAPPHRVQAVVLATLIGGAALSWHDTIGAGRLRELLPHPDQRTLEEMVRALPPDASVAAPGEALPALSRRRALYDVRKAWRVPAVVPDFILWKEERASDEESRRARDWLEAIRRSVPYREVLQGGAFTLLARET